MQKEIIGFLIDGVIYGGWHALDAAKANGNNFDKYITKEQAYFMAMLDLGHKWTELANAPVIIILDENGARLTDGYYTNAAKEVFEIKDGQKYILKNAMIVNE